MPTQEEAPVGPLIDVGEFVDKWSFALYDGQESDVAEFAYHEETTARRAHMVIADAVAISPAFEHPFLFSVAHRLSSA